MSPPVVSRRVSRVKHLNPRQGITTSTGRASRSWRRRCVKHLNPRQGITTSRVGAGAFCMRRAIRVKHLNPRQGITTISPASSEAGRGPPRV